MRDILNSSSVFMKGFDCLAMGLTLALAVNMTIVFFLAFLNEGEVLVTVNTFGEQWIEAVLFPIWIIMGTITIIRLSRQTRRLKRVK